MDAAATALKSLRDFVGRLRRPEVGNESVAAEGLSPDGRPEAGAGGLHDRLMQLEQAFAGALADDLGSPQALAVLFDFVRAMNPHLQAGAISGADAEAIRATFRKLDRVLSLLDADAPLPFPEIPSEVQKLVADREEARRQQDFAVADRLRAEIRTKGYDVEDTPQGPRVIKSAC